MPTTTQTTLPVSTKISETEIKITQTATTTIIEDKVLNFTKEGLTKQREDIISQRDAQIAELQALKTKELAEVDVYLAECAKLGIK